MASYGHYNGVVDGDSSIALIRLRNREGAALTAAHEIGHMIDDQALPGAGFYTWRLGSVSDEMLAVFQAVQKTATYQDLLSERAKATGSWRRYLDTLMPNYEFFARIYAQWVAWKSGEPAMKRDLDIYLHGPKGERLKVWPHQGNRLNIFGVGDRQAVIGMY